MTTARTDSSFHLRAVVAAAAILGTGMAIGQLSGNGPDSIWYAGLDQPAFQPPGWAFGVVWTILYILLGLAVALVLGQPPSSERRDALWLFGGQLALNFAWSPIFFGMRMIEVALVVLVAMLVLALAAAKYFRRLQPMAGWLMLPYLLWLCLAVALTYETGRLNPGADSAPLGLIGA